MKQYAANVTNDFERKAGTHANEESPGLVADTQEDLHQQIDGKDSSKEGIAPQRRQVADLLELIAKAGGVESIVERALFLISLINLPTAPTSPTKSVTTPPPFRGLTRTLNVVSILSNVCPSSQLRNQTKEIKHEKKSIENESLPFPQARILSDKSQSNRTVHCDLTIADDK